MPYRATRSLLRLALWLAMLGTGIAVARASGPQGGRLFFGHTGGGPGIDTGIQLDLNRDLALVFLSNYSPPFPQQLAADLGKVLDNSSARPSG